MGYLAEREELLSPFTATMVINQLDFLLPSIDSAQQVVTTTTVYSLRFIGCTVQLSY